ncbi:hypothetical protein J0J30_23345, partial [Vibrio vulnificus]|nr:hypothetical protein [Vibrio vulnificus]
IKQISLDGYNWLVQIEPEYWTSSLFKGEPYGHVTFNIAHLYSKWIEEARELPIIQKLETFRCKIMELIQIRRTASEDWTTKLTPSKEKSLEE